MLKRVDLSRRDLWESSLATIPHGFCHRWDHAQALARSGAAPFLLTDGSSAVVLLERRYEAWIDVTTPYGFAGPAGVVAEGEFLEGLLRYASKKKWVAGYLALHPQFCSWERFPFASPARTVFVVDLAKSESELWHRLEGKSVRSDTALAAGWTLEDDRAALASDFPALYRSTCERVGAAPVYRFSDETLSLYSKMEGFLWLGARDTAGRVVSIAGFGASAWGAEYFFQASTTEGRRATGALLWEGMLRLKALGLPWVNLGGGSVEGDGLEKFKSRFGGERLTAGRWTRVFDDKAYGAACSRRGIRDRNYFPVYQAPETRS